MSQISVECSAVDGGWMACVTVTDHGSFRFLLAREPKESILRSFGLSTIVRYFPEFEREIKPL
jgi:hypothetical protein